MKKSKEVKLVVPKIETKKVTVIINEKEYEVEVKRGLTLAENAHAVNDALDMIFGDDGKTYLSWVTDFAIDYVSYIYLTNIKMPEDAEEAATLIRYLNEQKVLGEAGYSDNESYFAGAWKIREDVDAAVEYRKQELLKKNKFDDALDDILDLIKMISEKVESMGVDGLVNMIESVIPGFKEELAKGIAGDNIFGGGEVPAV